MYGNVTGTRYIKSANAYAQIGVGATVNVTIPITGVVAGGLVIAEDSGEGAPLPAGVTIGVGKTTSGNVVIPLINGSETTAAASTVGLRFVVFEARGAEVRLAT